MPKAYLPIPSPPDYKTTKFDGRDRNPSRQGNENPQAAFHCEGKKLREPEILTDFRAAR
jgi:hypothetical protein